MSEQNTIAVIPITVIRSVSIDPLKLVEGVKKLIVDLAKMNYRESVEWNRGRLDAARELRAVLKSASTNNLPEHAEPQLQPSENYEDVA